MDGSHVCHLGRRVDAVGAFMNINKLYKPSELIAAQQALMHNGFHDFDPNDASAIIVALHKLGFRIVYVGKVGE